MMNEQERIDELKHFGVKGMKWGKRTQRAINTVAFSKVGKAIGKMPQAGKNVAKVFKEAAIEGTKYNINMATHPIASIKSTIKDTGNGSYARALRVGLVGRTPGELKKVNEATKKIVMDKRNIKLKKKADRAKQNELLKKWADEVDKLESKGMDYKTAVKKADANLDAARKKAGLGDTKAEKLVRKGIGAAASITNKKKKP